MEFLIADTFTASLGKLNPQEQKAAKTTAFDLQLNPAHPGLQFHRLERVKDPNFWSVRVNNDIRIIVHKTDGSLTLCYVDHHDPAYNWASVRKMTVHPHTGAAQLVQIRETIEEITIPVYTAVESSSPSNHGRKLFSDHNPEHFLQYGIPEEWISHILEADEESIFSICDHLPSEAAEALFELAAGGHPEKPVVDKTINPFYHPDARRRFHNPISREELERALEYPWDKWTVFLHPAQRKYVEMEASGPVRISGSAGTGKTIVALHRTVFLAKKYPESTLFLTTYSRVLANSLRELLHRLCGNDHSILSRVTIESLEEFYQHELQRMKPDLTLVTDDFVKSMIVDIAQKEGSTIEPSYLFDEWTEIVEAWNVKSMDDYDQIISKGRKSRIGKTQRESSWIVYEKLLKQLNELQQTTPGIWMHRLSEISRQRGGPFDFCIVDEAQDMSVPALTLLKSIAKEHAESLFFTGDLGQRIFQYPFPWKSIGIHITGRSHRLKLNYRTSRQIRRKADSLLPTSIQDLDGIQEKRNDIISVFDGPDPIIKLVPSEKDEIEFLASWIKGHKDRGLSPEAIAVFYRIPEKKGLAESAITMAGEKPWEIDTEHGVSSGFVIHGTMHQAKGLEFHAVAVVSCNDGLLPLESRVAAVNDEIELDEVYNTERHLLYVSCTRARDFLLITGVEPGSEFLDDLF